MQHQEQVIISDFGEYNDKHVYYHYVDINKYRNDLLTNEVAIRLNEIVREIADINDWTIYEFRIEKEHIHLLFSASPEWIPSAIDSNADFGKYYDGIEFEDEFKEGIIHKLKGKTSKILREEFPHLENFKNRNRKHFWSKGGYLGTISQEINPPYDSNKDYEYKIKSASHKVHVLYFFYRIKKDKLEKLIGFDNLMQFKPTIDAIIKNEYKNKYKKPVGCGFEFYDDKFKHDGDDVSFLIRSKQTFPPIWILKSILKKLIKNPTDDQMKEWLNSWNISSQGPKFNTVQAYIDNHDDPWHDKK